MTLFQDFGVRHQREGIPYQKIGSRIRCKGRRTDRRCEWCSCTQVNPRHSGDKAREGIGRNVAIEG